MKINFDKARWSEDSQGFWLCLGVEKGANTGALKQFVTGIKGRYVAELKRFCKRRSLDANAYFWLLCGKLSAVLRVSPEDIYRQYIPDIGGNYEIVPIAQDKLERWEKLWTAGHLGRICEDIGECRNVKGYHNVRSYMGSSDYDGAQMSRLLDLIIDDCKAQGIDTATPEELSLLKEQWG